MSEAPTDAGWGERLAQALEAPHLDEVEALRAAFPPLSGVPPDVTALATRIAALTGREAPAGRVGAEQLAWWLDALLLQRVVRVPQSRDRQLLPVFFGVLAILLGLLLGRLVGAGVVLVGLGAWAIRYGGAVRERRGAWLRLGDEIFDLRTARVERLTDGWTLVEGRRVPTALFEGFTRLKP
ncbi:MAG: hypothetical protein INH41_21880 [Myxococcaceae bacterium]|nr:hypothetical protein [Myxococcaceae bacterium]MCA3015046.1 hypothetical protein [Myxococcaceae bacterium]